MKPIVLYCIIFFMFIQSAFAEIDTEFTGYLEDTIMGEYVKNDEEENIFHNIPGKT